MFRYFIAFCLTFLLIPAFANDYVIHAGRFVDVIDGSVQEDILNRPGFAGGSFI